MSQGFEVGKMHYNSAGSKPNALTVALYDKALLDRLKEFLRQAPPNDWFIGKPTDQYDEYWLIYHRDVETLFKQLNLWLWGAVVEPSHLERLAIKAASEVDKARFVDLRVLKSGEYEIHFEINGKILPPYRFPETLLQDAASNGQNGIVDDIFDWFVALLVDFQITHGGS